MDLVLKKPSETSNVRFIQVEPKPKLNADYIRKLKFILKHTDSNYKTYLSDKTYQKLIELKNYETKLNCQLEECFYEVNSVNNYTLESLNFNEIEEYYIFLVNNQPKQELSFKQRLRKSKTQSSPYHIDSSSSIKQDIFLQDNRETKLELLNRNPKSSSQPQSPVCIEAKSLKSAISNRQHDLSINSETSRKSTNVSIKPKSMDYHAHQCKRNFMRRNAISNPFHSPLSEPLKDTRNSKKKQNKKENLSFFEKIFRFFRKKKVQNVN